MPAEADALADLERLDLGAHGRDLADDLVAGDEGILADAPIVGDQVQIAVADAAVGDGDFDFVRAELAWVVAEGQKFRSRRMGCKSLNLSHVIAPNVLVDWLFGPAESPEAPVRPGRGIEVQPLLV